MEEIADWTELPEIENTDGYELELDNGEKITIGSDELPLLAYTSRKQLYDHLGYKIIPVGWDGSKPVPVIEELETGEYLETKGVAIGRNFIIRDGNYIADVSDRYNLIPNELISEIGKRIASTVGASLWKDKSDDRHLYQYYLTDNEVGPNNELKTGFLLINSIDGSSSARFQAFMYRSVCENGMIFGKQNMGQIWARHTKNLEVNLQTWYKAAVMAIRSGQRLAKSFEEFPEIPLNCQVGSDFMERIKLSDIPNTYRPDYLKVPGKRLSEKDIPDVPEGLNMWDVYNEITNRITFPVTMDGSAREISEGSRINLHLKLEKAIQPFL